MIRRAVWRLNFLNGFFRVHSSCKDLLRYSDICLDFLLLMHTNAYRTRIISPISEAWLDQAINSSYSRVRWLGNNALSASQFINSLCFTLSIPFYVIRMKLLMQLVLLHSIYIYIHIYGRVYELSEHMMCSRCPELKFQVQWLSPFKLKRCRTHSISACLMLGT
jgi:hypothetical protein